LLRALIHKQTQTNDIHNLSLHDALPIFNVTQSAIKTAVVRINLTRLFQECSYSGKSFINCAMSNQKKLSEKIIIGVDPGTQVMGDRKSTRLNSSHVKNSYAVFCLKNKRV